jgi:hypothetical protein
MNSSSHLSASHPHDDFDLLAGIVVRRALDQQRQRTRAAAVCSAQPVGSTRGRQSLAARLVGQVRMVWQRQHRARANTWHRAVQLPLETLAMAAPGGKA